MTIGLLGSFTDRNKFNECMKEFEGAAYGYTRFNPDGSKVYDVVESKLADLYERSFAQPLQDRASDGPYAGTHDFEVAGF